MLTQPKGIVDGNIGFSAAVMSGKKGKSFEFQRKSPPFGSLAFPEGKVDFLRLAAKKTDEGLSSNAEHLSAFVGDYPSSVTFGDSSSSEEPK